jgi:hypothetical protein
MRKQLGDCKGEAALLQIVYPAISIRVMNRIANQMGWAAAACALLVGCLLAAGCRTSTIDTRRAERQAAYDALPHEWQEIVDQGQIRVGMPMDAVFIAWGQPAETLESQARDGSITVTWLYHGAWLEKTRYWAYREVQQGDRTFLERYLTHDYDPRSYVQAEIVFEEGVVKSWRTLPRPL